MMITASMYQNVMLEPFIVRALSSITAQQAEAIVEAVRAAGSGWTAQTTHDYDGYLSLMIEPCVDGDGQSAFFVSGTAQCLELSEMRDDTLTTLGTFSNVEPLLTQLQNHIRQQGCSS